MRLLNAKKVKKHKKHDKFVSNHDFYLRKPKRENKSNSNFAFTSIVLKNSDFAKVSIQVLFPLVCVFMDV